MRNRSQVARDAKTGGKNSPAADERQELRPSRLPRWAVAIVSLIFIIIIFFQLRRNTNTNNTFEISYNTESYTIREGNVGGVEYYHCDSTSEEKHHLVLLHGAKFTKEDWKTCGLLDRFCSVESFAVTALDLDRRAGGRELLDVLEAMKKESMNSGPIVLVTPSASGNTVVDWVLNKNVVPMLQDHVGIWIPIAPPSVMKLSVQHLGQLKALHILAVNGDKDVRGAEASDHLQSTAGAKVFRAPGGHAFYIDFPDGLFAPVVKFIRDVETL